MCSCPSGPCLQLHRTWKHAFHTICGSEGKFVLQLVIYYALLVKDKRYQSALIKDNIAVVYDLTIQPRISAQTRHNKNQRGVVVQLNDRVILKVAMSDGK